MTFFVALCLDAISGLVLRAALVIVAVAVAVFVAALVPVAVAVPVPVAVPVAVAGCPVLYLCTCVPAYLVSGMHAHGTAARAPNWVIRRTCAKT